MGKNTTLLRSRRLFESARGGHLAFLFDKYLMKIFEIIEPRTVEKQRKVPFDLRSMDRHHEYHLDIHNKKDSGGNPEPPAGRGVYSKGRTSIRDPFMFTKLSVYPRSIDYLEDDAYFNYVQAIRPYIASNPYFPRVYIVKLEKDERGLIRPKYQMEKLLSRLDLGDNDTADSLLESINQRIFTKSSCGHRGDPERLFYLIPDALITGSYRCITDPLLKEALKIIRSVKKSGQFTYDLHANNILFRRTAQGIWPVLTDPLI